MRKAHYSLPIKKMMIQPGPIKIEGRELKALKQYKLDLEFKTLSDVVKMLIISYEGKKKDLKKK